MPRAIYVRIAELSMNDLEKIAWTDEFSVGNKRLDEQHFKIVSFINKLIDLPSFNSQAEALEYITQMLAYSREHLDYEEQILRENDYEEYSSHAVIHQFYIKKVEGFLKMSFNDNDRLKHEILKFLKEWWTYHILEEDMKYRPFLESKGLT